MINLRRVTAAEFDVFLKICIPQFAANKVRSGNWPKEGALERSQRRPYYCRKDLPPPTIIFLPLSKGSQ